MEQGNQLGLKMKNALSLERGIIFTANEAGGSGRTVVADGGARYYRTIGKSAVKDAIQ